MVAALIPDTACCILFCEWFLSRPKWPIFYLAAALPSIMCKSNEAHSISEPKMTRKSRLVKCKTRRKFVSALRHRPSSLHRKSGWSQATRQRGLVLLPHLRLGRVQTDRRRLPVSRRVRTKHRRSLQPEPERSSRWRRQEHQRRQRRWRRKRLQHQRQRLEAAQATRNPDQNASHPTRFQRSSDWSGKNFWEFQHKLNWIKILIRCHQLLRCCNNPRTLRERK